MVLCNESEIPHQYSTSVFLYFFLYKNLLILVDFEVESHATSILQQGNINQEVGLITNPDIKILID